MAFRTIVIKSRCKLEYSLNYLICKKENNITRILIDEIKILIIDTLQAVITTTLISECINKKIKIIFTDSKHNPNGELVGYDNNFYSYRKIKEQLSFEEEFKNILWMKIIKQKILNQEKLLINNNLVVAADKLKQYIEEVQIGDTSNREGHAAKVYFNALFGNEFNRDLNTFENKVLNYGYAILLSTINREIKILGYLTELGIHHIGESNSFNLSCDFIEPLRPLVDTLLVKGLVNEENYKMSCVSLLSLEVKYNNQEILLENAIRLYIEDLISYLKTKDESKIRFIEYEL